MASPLAKIGIISIGDMGMGLAKLLIAHNFAVATNCSGRSSDTLERARGANVELLSSDEDLARVCAVILSVVPPRDAIQTAQRFADAAPRTSRPPANPLYFADLNAVAPSSAKKIGALFERTSVRFVDGCILGLPPTPKTSDSKNSNGDVSGEWNRPSIPTSGPHAISSIPGFGPALAAALNMRHVSEAIGAASGLKMCFASFSKGLTALATQAYTTAFKLGVLPELRTELAAVLPQHAALAERGVTHMPPKAYRWVGEMEEIAATLSEEGGFPPDSFLGAASVYRTVADDTVLGQEKIGKRKRGTTVEDVAAAMVEGMQTKRKKND
ncbi:6-phosphogluconate dehydrogenase C-terminal domain-like protein [Hypoxylon sp. NC1633]|nr:6-phosphogluconate dehydrogenase C-terminal domain-like protein [Hypoxylon sp. NC1633]